MTRATKKMENPTTDYTALMEQMITDQQESKTSLGAGGYWLSHTQSMVSIVRQYGIENFRSTPEKALMAFATGSAYKPVRNQNRKLWQFHDFVKKIPIIKTLPRRYEQVIEKGYSSAKSQAREKLSLLYEYLKEKNPQFLETPETISGNPVTFEIDGKVYSELYLYKLHELHLLTQRLNMDKISSVFEIGGSFGLLASAFLNCFPHIKKYVILDVAPVPAFTEYYLNQTFPDEVESYYDTRTNPEISLENTKKRITILCSHQLSKLKDKVDLTLNTASFQEMEVKQVKDYCNFMKDHATYAYSRNLAFSDFNNLRTEDYKKMLDPMKAEYEWDNILCPQYKSILFKK